MRFLFTDIDNTLIYSHNRNLDQEKIVVEHLNGLEQSFMTKHTFEWFGSHKKIKIIPVTTRTLAQYSRLEFLDDLFICEAIVYNGGMRLVNGIEDQTWSAETMNLVADQLEDLNSAVAILEKDYAKGHIIHRPVPYMAYIKIDSPQEMCEDIKNKVNLDNVTVQNDRKKLYLFASRVNKGNAVQRFCKKENIKADMVAGDDIMDITMLNQASCAFVSEKIADMVDNGNKIVLTGEVISDQLCDEIERMIK